jgi:valyl-tRNA synthetase
MDEGLSNAVLETFVRLYDDGLIYRGKRLINWDPVLGTAVSDLEVEKEEEDGTLWEIRYPLIDGSGHLTVATTRPETMLGDVAVAVNPDDERYARFVGKEVELPLTGRRIPVITDASVDKAFGTGGVKITPAHDFNDFEVGKRHNLLQVNIFTVEAKLQLKDNADFVAGIPNSADLDATLAMNGTDRFAARKAILARLEEKGLVEKIEPQSHVVPHGDRSNVVIEPFLTDQWYVNAKELAKPAIAAVRAGKTKFIPKNWEKTYFDWMENIQPWCISRQLWWGHQIPAWYGLDNKVFVALTEAEAQTDADKHYGKKTKLTRDEDVLDTWFSSALWPFSTLGWPDNTPELKRYYPTSALVTGFDIIFFWVARMMMMGLHFMKEIPFHDVYIHALVRDASGAKMSKSKGNVIDPLALIDEYGADALRFTLAAMAAQGRDIKLSTQRVEGYRNFATKLWNAARFAEMNGCASVANFDPKSAKETLNRWIAHETAKAATEITEAIEAYRFNDAAAAVYRFVWNIYCDWYLELAKPLLTGADGAAKGETQAMVAWGRDEILKLLQPFMPFITEELWTVTGKHDALLALDKWPQLAGLSDDKAEAEIGWVIDLVTAIRSVRAEMNITAAIPLVLAGASAETKARAERWAEFIKRLARVSDISSAATPPQGSVQLVVRGETAALPLKGVIDVAAERARLGKEMQKADADIGRVDAKLNNPNFMARAAEEVVEEEKQKREEAVARKAKIAEALERLKGAT